MIMRISDVRESPAKANGGKTIAGLAVSANPLYLNKPCEVSYELSSDVAFRDLLRCPWNGCAAWNEVCRRDRDGRWRFGSDVVIA